MGYRRIAVALMLAIAAIALLLQWPSGDSRSSESLLNEAREALRRREYTEAEELGRILMTRDGHFNDGCFLTAKALSQQSEAGDAIDLFDQIPDDDPQYGIAARVSAGELLLFRSHRLSAAKESFERALRIDPHHAQVHERLSYIYGIAGLTWRAVPHRMALLCQNQFGPVHLLLLALGPAHEENSDSIRRYHASDPNDPLALCGMARLALREGRTDRAIELLEAVPANHSDWPEPLAWYGKLLLLTQPEDDRLRRWDETLPDSVVSNAEIWVVRGLLAKQRQRQRTAVRCFAEAVRREPNDQAANFQLANALMKVGEPQRARPFLARARLLEELTVAVKMWQIAPTRSAPLERAVQLCSELRLTWEARGWQRLLDSKEPTIGLAPLQEQSTTPLSPPATGGFQKPGDVLLAYRAARVSRSFEGIIEWDVAEFPLPKSTPTAGTRDPDSDLTRSADGIRFDNDAPLAGLTFLYRNGSRPERPGEHMFESTGGGVGVLDYDLDGWPDLEFTQGCDWPPPAVPAASARSRYLDRLFRNIQGERFEDVTIDAGVIEDRFSQGLAVGDVDNDGFPDLYVANIGGNRLFHNNGDGSFSDISDEAGVAGNSWSTSCAIADFNGDSLPDIYVVNYVRGEGMFDRPCVLPDGAIRLCTPYEFEAADDCLYQNLGDGRFRDVSSDSGIRVPDGKGLGLVAADFERTGKVSLFVANDTVPNFYFRNCTKQTAGVPTFEERGFVTGVAVDALGQSQACMGIACGDANGDGLLDLFVTNFRHEANALYTQQAGFMFSDVTREARLYEPSFGPLGFGTQFVDADLDGHLELIVTNGHVGNFSHRGIDYRMPTQIFWNAGNGRFDELPAGQLGAFFQTRHLGRGLARLDWNRDGRDDLAVSHLEERAALLTNRSATTNRYLSLRLQGVSSSRDAVGATAHVTCGLQTLTGQVTAGDGFQASNEKRLTFGLGQSQTVDKLEIHWPSGQIQTFRNLQSNVNLLIVENSAAPMSLPDRQFNTTLPTKREKPLDAQ